jgi:hypothetical protein
MAAAGASRADAETITKQFNGDTWQLIAGFRQPTTQALTTSGIRSLFTTDQNSGLTSTSEVFSTVTANGAQYANQDTFGVENTGYLLEGYNANGTSRNIQGVISTGPHTWSQLGTATIAPSLALPSGITVTGASLFNASGSVTPTYRYLAQSNGTTTGLFTADTGDFILMGVTDSATQGSTSALDTTFNGASNSIGLGMSDGNGVGNTVAANWAPPSTTIRAITTRSAGNAHGGTVSSQAGSNPDGWVLVWGRPEAIITPVAAAVKNTTMQFRVDFAAGTPSGLAADDFTVGGTSTGWSVASVTGSGSGPYTVTVNGIAPTQGTVTLSLGAGSVTLGASSFPDAPIASTAATTYDAVAPGATSLIATALNVIASPVTYTLNLSEAPVTPLSAANFIVSGTSGGWRVQSITGSGAGPYTVTVANQAGIPPNGTINLGLRAGSLTDTAGNTGPIFQYNAAPVTLYRGLDLGTPSVSSFTAVTASTTTSPVTFSLSFDQLVSGLTPSDFSLGGTSTGWTVSGVSGSGTGPYAVTVSRATPLPGGTLTLILRSGAVIDRSNLQGPLASATSPVVADPTLLSSHIKNEPCIDIDSWHSFHCGPDVSVESCVSSNQCSAKSDVLNAAWYLHGASSTVMHTRNRRNSHTTASVGPSRRKISLFQRRLKLGLGLLHLALA